MTKKIGTRVRFIQQLLLVNWNFTKGLKKRLERRNHLHSSTPLHISASYGSLEIFKYLLEKSCNKNPKNKYGVTPLHLAVTNGHFDICMLLIPNVLDINSSNRMTPGRTLLHEAANKGHLDICKLLFHNPRDKKILLHFSMLFGMVSFIYANSLLKMEVTKIQ